MENVRIAILDTYGKVLAFLDNTAPKALHYFDDELHTYKRLCGYVQLYRRCEA